MEDDLTVMSDDDDGSGNVVVGDGVVNVSGDGGEVGGGGFRV
jgi:hypothetical protein